MKNLFKLSILLLLFLGFSCSKDDDDDASPSNTTSTVKLGEITGLGFIEELGTSLSFNMYEGASTYTVLVNNEKVKEGVTSSPIELLVQNADEVLIQGIDANQKAISEGKITYTVENIHIEGQITGLKITRGTTSVIRFNEYEGAEKYEILINNSTRASGSKLSPYSIELEIGDKVEVNAFDGNDVYLASSVLYNRIESDDLSTLSGTIWVWQPDPNNDLKAELHFLRDEIIHLDESGANLGFLSNYNFNTETKKGYVANATAYGIPSEFTLSDDEKSITYNFATYMRIQ